MFKGKPHIAADKLKLIFKYVKIAMFIAFYIFFWSHSDFYSQISEATGVPVNDFLLKRILLVTILCAGGIFLSIYEIKLSEKLNKLVLIGAAVLTPAVSFFALEYANIRKSRLIILVFVDMGMKRVILTIAILMLVMIAIYLISNRIKLSAIGLAVIVVLFGLICYYVYEFRGIPFLASDLSTVGAAMSVAGGYNYDLTYYPFMLLLVMSFWCVLISQAKEIKGIHWKRRLIAATAYVVIAIAAVRIMVYTDFLENKLKVTFSTFRPEKSYGYSGSVLAVIRSIRVILVEKPEGYSVEAAMKIAERYPDVTDENAIEPNVIIVMNEAFSDLQSINNNLMTNKETLPYLKELKEKEDVVSGEMYVSGFGGNTANTEFEVLTGCSQAFAPPSSTSYQLFIKDIFPSLTHTFKERGYQGNMALHPYAPTGYNRQAAYPFLGFEEFFSIKDFKNAKKVRRFVSDESIYNKIIEEYEVAKKSSDNPFYAFTVTMQNHSGYYEEHDNLSKDIEILDSDFQDERVERYLNLIHISDAALKQLITYFENKEEPTIVVFFGDHQPRLPKTFYHRLTGKSQNDLTDEELMQEYKVPFVIWANYDIEGKKNVKTSANYMSSLILDSAKMKATRWSSFLADTAREIPVLNVVGYFGADDKFYSLEENSPYSETLKNYQILQYNNMFDRGHRIENFFDK